MTYEEVMQALADVLTEEGHHGGQCALALGVGPCSYSCGAEARNVKRRKARERLEALWQKKTS